MHFKGHFWDSENNDLQIKKNGSLRLDSDFLSWWDRDDGIFWTEQHKHKCMLSVETIKKNVFFKSLSLDYHVSNNNDEEITVEK